jgi:hypothetical protein
MLVTPYVRYLIGLGSPTYEFARVGAGGTFDRYTEHFANVWKTAKEQSP